MRTVKPIKIKTTLYKHKKSGIRKMKLVTVIQEQWLVRHIAKLNFRDYMKLESIIINRIDEAVCRLKNKI